MRIEDLALLIGRCAERGDRGLPPINWEILAVQIRNEAGTLVHAYRDALAACNSPSQETLDSAAVGVAVQLAILVFRALVNHPLIDRSPLRPTFSDGEEIPLPPKSDGRLRIIR